MNNNPPEPTPETEQCMHEAELAIATSLFTLVNTGFDLDYVSPLIIEFVKKATIAGRGDKVLAVFAQLNEDFEIPINISQVSMPAASKEEFEKVVSNLKNQTNAQEIKLNESRIKNQSEKPPDISD